MPTSPEDSEYMLLLRQPHTGAPPTPDQLREIMNRFTSWMDGMTAKNIVAGTSGLEPTGKVLRDPRGTSVTDGPYIETKEIVGGYVIIKARDLEEAVEIARDCPGLDYRMTVEIRPVKHMERGGK